VIHGSQFKMPQAVYFAGNVFAKGQLGTEASGMQEKPLCSKAAIEHLRTFQCGLLRKSTNRGDQAPKKYQKPHAKHTRKGK
jgi:hypothetical protein